MKKTHEVPKILMLQGYSNREVTRGNWEWVAKFKNVELGKENAFNDKAPAPMTTGQMLVRIAYLKNIPGHEASIETLQSAIKGISKLGPAKPHGVDFKHAHVTLQPIPIPVP